MERLIKLITLIIIVSFGYWIGLRGLILIICSVVGLFIDWAWWAGAFRGNKLRRELKSELKNIKTPEDLLRK